MNGYVNADADLVKKSAARGTLLEFHFEINLPWTSLALHVFRNEIEWCGAKLRSLPTYEPSIMIAHGISKQGGKTIETNERGGGWLKLYAEWLSVRGRGHLQWKGDMRVCTRHLIWIILRRIRLVKL